MALCRSWPGYGGIGSFRRVAIIFRHAGFVMIPRLRAPHEDVGLWPKPAWIVQRADSKANQIRAGRNLHVERRAAIAAENADVSLPLSAFVAYRLGVPWRMRNPALGTRAAGTCAAPLCLWQSRQWQRSLKTGSPTVS